MIAKQRWEKAQDSKLSEHSNGTTRTCLLPAGQRPGLPSTGVHAHLQLTFQRETPVSHPLLQSQIKTHFQPVSPSKPARRRTQPSTPTAVSVSDTLTPPPARALLLRARRCRERSSSLGKGDLPTSLLPASRTHSSFCRCVESLLHSQWLRTEGWVRRFPGLASRQGDTDLLELQTLTGFGWWAGFPHKL